MADLASGPYEMHRQINLWLILTLAARFVDAALINLSFWECASAQVAWKWGIHVMNLLVAKGNSRGPWRPLN